MQIIVIIVYRKVENGVYFSSTSVFAHFQCLRCQNFIILVNRYILQVSREQQSIIRKYLVFIFATSCDRGQLTIFIYFYILALLKIAQRVCFHEICFTQLTERFVSPLVFNIKFIYFSFYCESLNAQLNFYSGRGKVTSDILQRFE